MARPISIKLVEDTARELMARAAIDIPADYREGVRRARDRAQNRIARFVLTEMDRNWDIRRGRSLFALANRQINLRLNEVYRGLAPFSMGRFGEPTARQDEVV